MNSLSSIDARCVVAAEGWLALGDPKEAQNEIQFISPPNSNHPKVLEIKWQILAALGRWEDCLSIAELFVDCAPRNEVGRLFLGTSLKALGRVEDAYEMLSETIDNYPESAVIPFQLACYGCELGLLEEAKRWVAKAVSCNDSPRFKKRLLEEPELAPLWKKIATM